MIAQNVGGRYHSVTQAWAQITRSGPLLFSGGFNGRVIICYIWKQYTCGDLTGPTFPANILLLSCMLGQRIGKTKEKGPPMKRSLAVLGALLFVTASASASAIYNFSVNATKDSALTDFSLTCSGMPSSCGSITAGQVSVSSGPGTGASLSSLLVESTLDVATFASTSGESWTFDLYTIAITGMTTYTFTGSSVVSEGSFGPVTASGSLAVSKMTAMPEPMTLWSLLLVLVPIFFVCWRQARTAPANHPIL